MKAVSKSNDFEKQKNTEIALILLVLFKFSRRIEKIKIDRLYFVSIDFIFSLKSTVCVNSEADPLRSLLDFSIDPNRCVAISGITIHRRSLFRA